MKRLNLFHNSTNGKCENFKCHRLLKICTCTDIYIKMLDIAAFVWLQSSLVISHSLQELYSK